MFIFTETPKPINDWALNCGDVVDGLRHIQENSVNLWLTSPPYFHQVDYDIEGQYGLENNVAEYIYKLEYVAREMLEKTTPDGLLFFVIRDSANGVGGPGGDYRNKDGSYRFVIQGAREKGWPRKSQLLIPERIRIAFADVGWIPIQSIIWDKKDSRRGARDRPSYSYEHVMLFSKSPDHYWNRSAVYQEYSEKSKPQLEQEYKGKSDLEEVKSRNKENPSDLKRRMIKTMEEKPGAYLRSVWHIPPGSKPKVCVDGEEVVGISSFPLLLAEICVNLGSRPGDLVADPFAGMGTTLLAALKWGRRAIGIEKSEKFFKAACVRINKWDRGSVNV